MLELIIIEELCKRTIKVCESLEKAKNITKKQSSDSLASLSLSAMAFKFLIKKCQKVIFNNESVILLIAGETQHKLKE